MKTAEEILKQHFDTLHMHESNQVVNAMIEYADQFRPKWISTQEQLPEEGQIVDVFTSEEGRQTNVTFEKGLFVTYPKNVHILIKHTIMLPIQWVNVTHWMPLPTKP